MGGLGPGIGGLEILVIGLLALIVVGPKDLPLLMRKVGRAVGKARSMANEFRSSFDEMARQSELDELRKEVEALRTGQGMVPLGAEAEATFREISSDLNQPLHADPVMLPSPDEWPDSPPATAPVEVEDKAPPQPRAKAAPKPRKTPAASPKARPASVKAADGRSRTVRAKKLDL